MEKKSTDGNWEDRFQKWREHRNKKKARDRTTHKVKIPEPIRAIEKKIEQEVKTHPALTKTLIFLAFAIPIAILLYAFYINYLPFGYENSYELTIDEEGIISPLSKEIYLTNSKGRKLLSLPEGVEGQVNLVIEPNVVLKNATVSIELKGDGGVYLGTPMTLDLSEIGWDRVWDFNEGIPSELEGNVEHTIILNGHAQGCAKFDAVHEQTLSLPNSSDMFESGPMSIYVKWKPSKTSEILGNYQQLIGHYNWEIYQGEKQIRFQVGRMNDSNGPFYSVTYSITPDFFEQEHELLAIYSPDKINGEGYIELHVDGNFAQRVSIDKDTIYEDYNSDRDLNFGWTSHSYGKNPNFDGCIYESKIKYQAIKEEKTSETIQFDTSLISIPIIGYGNLESIKVDVSQ